MNYINTSLKWEEVFIPEALALEEKMNSVEIDDLKKSRLRISLEYDILKWSKYRSWYTEKMGCASVKDDLSDEQLFKIANLAKLAFNRYSGFSVWNEDLFPVAMWEDSIVVLGLQYDEKLVEVPNVIFIAASPKTLNYIYKHLNRDSELDNAQFLQVTPEFEGHLDASLVDLKASASHLNFSSLTLNPRGSEDEMIWDYLNERHEEYSFEAKKKFDAYAVLRIVNGRTSLYKMDRDLETLLQGKTGFSYDVTDEKNPFGKVYVSGQSEAFNLSQLRDAEARLQFKYLCVTALKRGDLIVGFLLGFKTNKLAEADQLLLEELANESA